MQLSKDCSSQVVDSVRLPFTFSRLRKLNPVFPRLFFFVSWNVSCAEPSEKLRFFRNLAKSNKFGRCEGADRVQFPACSLPVELCCIAMSRIADAASIGSRRHEVIELAINVTGRWVIVIVQVT